MEPRQAQKRVLGLLVLLASGAAAGACASLYGATDVPNPVDGGAGSDGTVTPVDGGEAGPTGDGAASEGGPDGGSDGGPDAKGDAGPCTNLQCQVNACGGDAGDAGTTTLTGTVFDPGGHNPLYNVVVYVPNAPGGALDAIPLGVDSSSCSCASLYSGDPIAVAVTDTAGNFVLANVPDGTNIPLVVQVGKWRKEILVPSIAPCTPNSVGKLTLPRNLSDGLYPSMPNIAVSTGAADAVECMLTRVGIDEAMFTGSASGPGVHIFQGTGGNAAAGSTSSLATLWDSQADLMRYDIVMLSCEGTMTGGVTSTTAGYLAPYLNAGGRVYAEHYHYAFFTDYSTSPGIPFPQFANVASWNNVGAASNDAPYLNPISAVVEGTLPDGGPFPEGLAFKTWLGNVGALDAGELVVPVVNARQNAVVGATNASTPWLQTDPTVTPPGTQYFSWDMPLGGAQHCGRVAYTDMHVAGSAADYTTSMVVPTGCDSASALAQDEDAIEFIFFDLASCLTVPGATPVSPIQ